MKENDTIPLALLILYQNVMINFYLFMYKLEIFIKIFILQSHFSQDFSAGPHYIFVKLPYDMPAGGAESKE